ncbi:MAG: CvpA family protein [Firmicutes bacterium]|nr:CvpA family protein [Bacillota bacterium]
MSIADVVLIVIIVMAALIGLLLGTGKSTVTLVAWLISFVAAFFLTRIVASSLFAIEAIEMIVVLLAGLMIEGGVGVSDALTSSYGIFCVLICIVLMIVVRLFMIIMVHFVKKALRKRAKKVSPPSRLGGFFINGAKGLAFTIMILIFASFIMAMPQMEFLRNDMEKSFMAKPMHEFVLTFNEHLLGPETQQRLAELRDKYDIQEPDIPVDPNEPDEPDPPEKEKATITFEDDGADNPVGPRTEEVGLEGIMLPVPVKFGHVFMGWFDNPGLTGAPITSPYTILADITLYAKWELFVPDEYTLSYVDNGADNGPFGDVVGVHDTLIDSLPAPLKDGYVFRGWFDNSAFTGSPVTAPFSLVSDITLYAKWEAKIDAFLLSDIQGLVSGLLYQFNFVADEAAFRAFYAFPDNGDKAAHEAMFVDSVLALHDSLPSLFANIASSKEAETLLLKISMEAGGDLYLATEAYLAELNATIGALDGDPFASIDSLTAEFASFQIAWQTALESVGLDIADAGIVF